METPPLPRPARLRVAVIASTDASNGPLLRALQETCDLPILLTVGSRPLSTRLRVLIATSGRFPVVPLARFVVLRAIDRLLSRRITRLLPEPPSTFEHVQTVPASHITGGEVAAQLAEEEPDLLVLSGAPILPEEVFTIPRLGSVNVHWGLARCYRGNHTLFYPLYRHEYDAVGVTLHYVDRGIDTGQVIAEERLAVGPSDTLTSVSVKAAEAVARLITAFVRGLAEGTAPEPATAVRGVLIRTRDRRVWHYAHYAVQRALVRAR